MPISQIGTNGIADSAVVAVDIAAGAVTSAKIATGAVALATQTSGVLPSASLPTGSVLQVLQNQIGTSTIGTSSSSFVTTGFGISITPRATTSKILITVAGGGAYMGTSASSTMYCTIYRNSTNLSSTNFGFERVSTPGGSWVLTPHSMSVLDSPSTTSSVTYTVYFRSLNGNEVQFSADDRGTTTITAMEIAG